MILKVRYTNGQKSMHRRMRKKIRILSVHVSTGLLIYKKEDLANADFSLNNL